MGDRSRPVPGAVTRRVALRIRQARERAGVSQAVLAFRLGWSQSALQRLESGRMNVTVEHLDAISAELGVAVSTLVRRRDPDVGAVVEGLVDELAETRVKRGRR